MIEIYKDAINYLKYYGELNSSKIENIAYFLDCELKNYIKLQSNWNSLREYIEENKKVAMEYTKRVEASGLCQGDYPVPYYHAIKRIDLDNLYLDKMNELEGKEKE